MEDISTSQRIVCVGCHERDNKTLDAVGFCKDCNEHLCGECFSQHTLPRLMRHHELIAKGDMPKFQRPIETDALKDKCTILCKEHGDVLKFYCKPDDIVICSECLNRHHMKCGQVSNIFNIASIDDFQDTNNELNMIRKEIDEVRKTSEDHMSNIREYSKSAKQDVESLRKQVSEFNDKLAREISQDIDVIDDKDYQRMGEIQRNCEREVEYITQLERKLGTLHESKKYCDLFVSIKLSAVEVNEIKDNILKDNKQINIKQYKFEAEPRLNEVLSGVKSYGSLVDNICKAVRQNVTPYVTPYQRKIHVKMGKLEDEETDIIVNSANIDLKLRQRPNTVTTAIATKSGVLAQTALNVVATGQDPKYGDVYDADPGKLKCKRLYHVILKQYESKTDSNKLLAAVIKTCLQKASKSGYKSISFPALGIGVLRYPISIVTKTFLDVAMGVFSSNKDSSITIINIVILDGDKNESNYEQFERELTRECVKAGVKKFFALS